MDYLNKLQSESHCLHPRHIFFRYTFILLKNTISWKTLFAKMITFPEHNSKACTDSRDWTWMYNPTANRFQFILYSLKYFRRAQEENAAIFFLAFLIALKVERITFDKDFVFMLLFLNNVAFWAPAVMLPAKM